MHVTPLLWDACLRLKIVVRPRVILERVAVREKERIVLLEKLPKDRRLTGPLAAEHEKLPERLDLEVGIVVLEALPKELV